MRGLFSGSYPLSDNEFKLLWEQGMFVFDANMLLNVYRYSDDTREKFLAIIGSESLAPRVWIPYQVAVEYHRNLDRVRYEQVAACYKMSAAIRDWSKSIRADDHRERAAQLLKLAETLVQDAQTRYARPESVAVVERIATLFDGKVGPEWDEKKLADVYKDGEERYKNKIPPGFKDVAKDKDGKEQVDGGKRKYGDLVIWRQIIEEASNRKKPVVLVTDDVKDDWWLDVGGRTIGPLPALRDEMRKRAGVLFYMYPGDRFLEQARLSLKLNVSEETVTEVRMIREEQQQKHHGLRTLQALSAGRSGGELPDLESLCPNCLAWGPWDGSRCLACGRMSDRAG